MATIGWVVSIAERAAELITSGYEAFRRMVLDVAKRHGPGVGKPWPEYQIAVDSIKLTTQVEVPSRPPIDLVALSKAIPAIDTGILEGVLRGLQKELPEGYKLHVWVIVAAEPGLPPRLKIEMTLTPPPEVAGKLVELELYDVANPDEPADYVPIAVELTRGARGVRITAGVEYAMDNTAWPSSICTVDPAEDASKAAAAVKEALRQRLAELWEGYGLSEVSGELLDHVVNLAAWSIKDLAPSWAEMLARAPRFFPLYMLYP